MLRSPRFLPGTLVLFLAGPTWAAPPALAVEPPVAATIDTTLRTAAGHIRQFAFDGDPNTYFASAQERLRQVQLDETLPPKPT